LSQSGLPSEEEEVPTTLEELEALREKNKNQITGKSSNGGAAPEDDWAVFTGKRRKRRAAGDEVSYPLSLGPLVMVSDQDVAPEDITQLEIQTRVPMQAMPDGTIEIMEIPEGEEVKESYPFKFNTTYVSDEVDEELFVKLLPEDRYVKDIEESSTGSYTWAHDKQTGAEKDMGDDKDSKTNVDDETEILVEELEEEELLAEEEMKENYAARAIAIIACFVIGGIILFAIALYISMQSDCLGFAPTKKSGKMKVEKSGSAIPKVVVAGPAMTDEKQLNNSCGSSLTSAE